MKDVSEHENSSFYDCETSWNAFAGTFAMKIDSSWFIYFIMLSA